MSNNKSTRGGARKGAGRKPGIEREYIGVKLPRYISNFLRSDPDKSITEMVEIAVSEYYNITDEVKLMKYEIGLFATIPVIGEKNPKGELYWEGYKRQIGYFSQEGLITNSISFPTCSNPEGVTVMSVVALDENNTVVCVNPICTGKIVYNGLCLTVANKNKNNNTSEY